MEDLGGLLASSSGVSVHLVLSVSTVVHTDCLDLLRLLHEQHRVAVRDLTQRHAVRPKNMPPSPTASPCVFAGDTLYCSAKSGFIPGPNGGVFAAATSDQVRQTMRNLLDNLEEAGMKFDQVVSTTIYLDDVSESAAFGNVYRKYFDKVLPAQTTVQQIKPAERKPDEEGHYPDLEQVSLIAVRGPANH